MENPDLLTIKEFAQIEHVTYEAVRRQVKRYAEELDGHILTFGRVKFLDSAAIDFLQGKRKTNPIVIYQTNKDEELEKLRSEKESLLNRIIELQDEIKECNNKIIELQNEKMSFLESLKK